MGEIGTWLVRVRQLLVRLLAALGLLWVIVTFTPLTTWWTEALTGGPYWRLAGDTLIVLGGDRYDTRTIGVTSYWRCVYAAEAYREHRFHTIVVSGGGDTEVPIAVTMRDCLVYHGVPKEAIRLETLANSTRQNAVNTERLLAGSPGKKVLLTSDIHMFRARRAFRKAGLNVLPWPALHVRRSTFSRLSRWSAFISLCRETAKIGYYYARGWI